ELTRRAGRPVIVPLAVRQSIACATAMGGDGTSIEAALHSACNRGSIPGLSSSLRRTRPAQVQENMSATWTVITDERSPSGVGGLMVAGRRSVGGSMRNRIWSGSFAAVIGVAAVTLTAQTT